jgi:hypothetical protein
MSVTSDAEVRGQPSGEGRVLWGVSVFLAIATVVGSYVAARYASDWTAGLLPFVGYLIVAAIVLSLLAVRAVRRGAVAVTVVTLFLSVLLVPPTVAAALAMGWGSRVDAALQDFQQSFEGGTTQGVEPPAEAPPVDDYPLPTSGVTEAGDASGMTAEEYAYDAQADGVVTEAEASEFLKKFGGSCDVNAAGDPYCEADGVTLGTP